MSARLAALLVVTLALRAGAMPGVMDRLVATFTKERRIGFQLVFETLDTDHDLDVNTTIAEVSEAVEAKGRVLALATAPYDKDGVPHRFVFAIRDGELMHFDLQRRSEKGWESAPQTVFWFDVADEAAPPDFLDDGEVVVTARGFCTAGRGATRRERAVVVLRSWASADGRPPSY